MGLYLKYFNIQLKSLMEYKKSFIIMCMSQCLDVVFALLAIFILFNKFGNIRGYSFDDILICFSVSYFGYAIADSFFRAFDKFEEMLGNGEFDRIMVRPRGLILQVLGSKIQFEKYGKALVAMFICIFVIAKRPELLVWNKIITLLLMIIGTIIIYAGLFILKAGITFFTTQSLEIMNIFTDGSRELAQYPLDIYQKWVKIFFTYIMPLALVNYYPLQYLINNTSNIMYALLPLFSVLFLIPCYIVWKIGVRKYRSTGS